MELDNSGQMGRFPGVGCIIDQLLTFEIGVNGGLSTVYLPLVLTLFPIGVDPPVRKRGAKFVWAHHWCSLNAVVVYMLGKKRLPKCPSIVCRANR